MLRCSLPLLLTALSAAAAPKVVRLETESVAGVSEQVRREAHGDASGGFCLRLGISGARNDAPQDRAADIVFSAAVPWRGATVAWGRVLARNGGSDSLYVAPPEGAFRNLSLPVSETWAWTVLEGLRPAADGTVSLRLQYRELGVLLDEVVFVSGRDLLPGADGQFRRQALRNPYAEPPVLPPTEHPRVFLRRQDLPALRARLAGPAGDGLRAELERQAEQPGDGILPPATDRERGNFSTGVGNTILANAYLGLLDGNEARRQRAVAMFANYFRTVQFADRRDVTRDYGEMLMTGGLVYDWCYDLLSPEWKAQFIEDALELAGTMEIGYPPTRQSAVTSHAGEAQLMRDQLAVAIAVHDEFPDWYRIAAGRFFQDFVPARNFFFPSHRHHQGDSYGPYRFQWSMFATWIFDRMGAGPVFTPEQGKVPYSWIYQRRPDGQLVRDGDTFLAGAYWSFPLALMLTASYYRDPHLECEYRRQVAVAGRDVPALWRALFHDPDVVPEPPDGLPLTKFFPEPLGAMIARTGWDQGVWSRTVVCEMKGAGHHFNNHHHLDAGGFQIYYRGGLATDAGCYGHYGIPYDWHWNKRSVAHNALLLHDPDAADATKHDGGQNYPNGRSEPATLGVLLEKGYRDGHVLAHAFGPDPRTPFFSHIKTDLTPGYADRAERIERSCVFLNTGDTARAAVLVVLDRVVARDARLRPVWLLHSVGEPALAGARVAVSRTDGDHGGRLTCDTLLPRAAERIPIGGSNAEARVFGQVFEADRPTTESGGWRVEISPRERTTSTLFLHALQVGDADGPVPREAQLVESDRLVGARVGDEIVLFAKDGQTLDGPIDLAVAGPDAVRLVATDLRPGFWRAEIGGQAASEAEATATGRTISLRVPPGSHRLVRADGRALPPPPREHLVPPPAAPAPEIVDGARPLSLRGALRQTPDGPLVALAPVAEAFGGIVRPEGTGLAVAMGDARAAFAAGRASALCNGQAVELARSPEWADGRLLVGLDALSLALRRACRWDAASGAVVVAARPAGQLFIQSVSASHAERRGSERFAVDGNPRTYWAAKEDGAWLQLDLGVPETIRAVGIGWLHGNQRRARFEILASLDGTQ